jgi:hypothetical protein
VTTFSNNTADKISRVYLHFHTRYRRPAYVAKAGQRSEVGVRGSLRDQKISDGI